MRDPSDRPRLVPALERATFRAEAPLRKAVRSNRLNPLPHAGTISVFLLAVVTLSGIYITLFFQFGFEASYDSVERMDEHAIQSVVRALHRYSSAALVLTTLVHAWRIFVAGRFRGPRRWRWTTGVASLVMVWLAGVTGYWLVWDRRAQGLNEATEAVLGSFDGGSAFVVRTLYGTGTGWGLLFVIWLAHLLLTMVIGWFVWRHVRRTKLAIVPPRHWMLIMFAALVTVSLLFPVGMLERADQARAVGDLDLDPFVLFLLPPLLDGWGWLVGAVVVIAITAALAVPHVVRRPTPVVAIDDDACTGCELCVIDCPYDALTMVEQVDETEAGTQPRRPLAAVVADACVGCGICLGSCSFGAMELPGFDAPDAVDPADRNVVIACARHVHAQRGDLADDTTVVEVPCSGMVHVNAVGALTARGARSVQVVGCPPGDCAFGLGNTVLHERLAGTRAPHVSRRWSGVASEDWVAPGDLVSAVADPNRHPDTDAGRVVTWRRAAGAIAVVAVSVGAVALATRAPYAGATTDRSVRVIVDHRPGDQLEGQLTSTGAPGDRVSVVVRADGVDVDRRSVPSSGGAAVGVVEVALPADHGEIDVLLTESTGDTVLYSGRPTIAVGERLVVQAVDVPPPPGIAAGRSVFSDRSLGACGVCHSTTPGDDGVGPSLAGVASRASERVAGLDAAEYLRQSVSDPDAYVVEGYRSGQMLPIYDERLSDEQIESLVQYLLTLEATP